jgi:hypothetical protein
VSGEGQDDLGSLRAALERTLQALELVRAGEPAALPAAVRSARPSEAIPLLEQEAADLRRDIRALERR